MKTNREIRKTTAEKAKDRWFWRLLTVIVVLDALPQVVNRLLAWAFTQNHIQTWQDFSSSWIKAHNSGLGYSVPSLRVAVEMTGSTLFLSFMCYVFLAIAALGVAVVALKATRNDSKDWFSSSFAGFKRPLGLVWFLAILNLRVCLWSLLFFFPGVVALYRYRNGWFLKSENPDWSVSKCLAESSRMMKGHKWAAFCLDAGYLVHLFLAILLWGAFVAAGMVFNGVVGRILFSVGSFFALLWMFRVIVSLTLARAEFYRETQLECASKPSESLS